MNKNLYDKIYNILEEQARQIIDADEEIIEKVKQMNEVANLMNIIDHFEELEPILKKYFKEKADKEKWNNESR